MDENNTKTCGIVMPISGIDGCTESHWSEVLEILNDAIEDAGFEGNLVSNADEVGIIHKRIIQNLYDNPVVVCDVSCKNPNVMFELGLRLAFDKPTIIVKDDKTSYSFDTSAIEHLEYPRDLRFSQIVEFKAKLSEKIRATYNKSTTDTEYTTFLKHFGEFKVAKLEKKEVSGQEFILDELKNLRRSMNRIERSSMSKKYGKSYMQGDIDICLGHGDGIDVKEKFELLMSHPGVRNVGVQELDPDHFHLTADVNPEFSIDSVRVELEKLVGRRSRRGGISKKSLSSATNSAG
ncbi:hypothetical protein K6U66_11490 [Vibrio alginolyticus]|uniref:hypothetical protein n=1 Tax=Vibrio alginolyticus TaxID=663 RepID=UPI001EEC854A|nr:hypothetical protein [Vibrio alginolyticus]ELB2803379.1 hypothetical protein [Vibrio alginolyticus]MCG6318407.1 hypothetical protein [Vibrio alginolyticus]MCR9568634.1 hypothetical protein [Vibrio alginolyticus]